MNQFVAKSWIPFAGITAVAIAGLLCVGTWSSSAEGHKKDGKKKGVVQTQYSQSENSNRHREANSQGMSSAKMDKCFAVSLILANQNEIRACQIAEQRAANADVKAFAKTMEQDHQQFLTHLQKFGGSPDAVQGPVSGEKTAPVKASDQAKATDPNAQNPTQSAVAAKPGAEETQQKDGAHRHAGEMDHHHQFLQIQREIAQQCRQSAERELAAKSGADFDKCFIGMQLATHMHMIDILTVFERHASPELKQELTKGRETAQAHLEHARNIMKTLDGQKVTTTTPQKASPVAAN